MRRQIPATRALLIFDTVARLHSMSKAADELCLTQSAVSQQLRGLEDQLGVHLLHRSARGVQLTEAGRQYHAQVASDLMRLENHTLEAMSNRPEGRRLVLGVAPVLGIRWVLPRLADFTAQHPNFTFHVKDFPTAVYLEEPGFDMAVHYDGLSWPGSKQSSLMPELCVVVCAPSSRWIQSISHGDFRQVPLLQLTSRLVAWNDWFDQASIEQKPSFSSAGHRFDMFAMISEAVRTDLGVALMPQFFVERELRDGSLVQGHPFVSQSARGYSVFVAADKVGDPLVKVFSEWLIYESREKKE